MDMFVSKGQSAQQIQAKAHSENWSRSLAEGKGRRGNVGKGRGSLVVFAGDIGGVGAQGHVRKILRARERGPDDRLRMSVLCSVSF